MRRLYVLFFTLCLISTAYAQNKTAEKTDPKTSAKTETKTENKDTKQPAKTEGGTEKLPDGYGNLTWGMYLSEAKDKISGTLSYTDEKKIIVSKDKELEYYYGFFYKEPATEKSQIKKEEAATDKKPETAADKKTETATDKKTDTTQEKDEGILFYVSISFPYLDQETVYNKIFEKYGKHTGENIKDNQGAIAWSNKDSDTIIIMWIDRYEKKPYSRRITYISKKISGELNKYTYTIFNKSELETINKMKP